MRREAAGRGRALAASAAAVVLAACATLGAVVQPPSFSHEPERASELRLLSPSADRPLGGAALRLWARVRNPNAFGLRITRLSGDLSVADASAGEVDLPLGLPLTANQDTVVPLEISLSLEDVPGLAEAAARAALTGALPYRLDGTLAVDAGPLGEPSFGPMRLLDGEVEVVR